MKNKLIALLFVIFVVGVIALGLGNIRSYSNAKKVTVASTGDGRGIFVGEQRPPYQESDPSKWTAETRKRVEEYETSSKTIDESWANRRKAALLFQDQRYDEAIEAYKKAYDFGKGDEAFFGVELVKAYEQLERYDEALALLDDIMSKVNLSDVGEQRFSEMRERLLAAKGKKRSD